MIFILINIIFSFILKFHPYIEYNSTKKEKTNIGKIMTGMYGVTSDFQ